MAVTKRTGVDGHPEALQDFASRHLVRAIVNGDVAPGAKLSPTKIAEELQISPVPVREALSGLEAAGHVVRIPRVGFFVAELSLTYIEDLYHWRQVLEDEAHRIAVPLLGKDDWAQMRKLNRVTSRAGRYSSTYLDVNREFHFIAFKRAGSENLLRILNNLWDAASRYQNAMSSSAVPRQLLRDQHDGLVEAFEARDAELVNQRMAEHRTITLEAIRRMVEYANTAAS